MGYSDPWQAVEALRAGRHEMVVGALPFLRDAPAALTVPESIIREPADLEPHAFYRVGPGSKLDAYQRNLDPDAEEHRRRVAAAVATIRRTRLDKVVLARAVDIGFREAVDPRLVAARLIDHSTNRDGFIADLSPAGGYFEGRMLVGCSPEVLIRRRGDEVTAYPMAGSAPRSSDPAEDRALAEHLAASTKDLDEHSYVVESLRADLTPLCSELDIPSAPELTATTEMWHLATPVRGRLKDPRTNALELALRVHPTPAICGTPRDLAEELITTAETDRGFYAGAVGWCGSTGDGEYMVAIRCAEVALDGLSARAWAGGGIVADSDPEAEYQETTAKLRTIMSALGL